MQIFEHGQDGLADYMSVSMGFWVRERFLVRDGDLEGPTPVVPAWWKDYDTCVEDRPDEFPNRFDVTPWGFLAAVSGEERVGGISIVMNTPEFELLERRSNLAHVIDLRVRSQDTGRGIGRALWNAAEAWAIKKGAIEIRVETQDVNVPACRFYQAMGCTLLAANRDFYGPEVDEWQLIWAKKLL